MCLVVSIAKCASCCVCICGGLVVSIGKGARNAMRAQRRAFPREAPPPQSVGAGGEGGAPGTQKGASNAKLRAAPFEKRAAATRSPARAAPEIPNASGKPLGLHKVFVNLARRGRNHNFAIAVWLWGSRRAKIGRVWLLRCLLCCLKAWYKLWHFSLGRRSESSDVRPHRADHRSTVATPKMGNLENFRGYNCVVGERALAVGMRGLAS